ncbi:hypothetical protein EYF80_016228 [Liparis tanakae]|uniref:Uncharacterized protein n=1 Tax=Liparis tanakae TaxID=230148 RepID=A0A4Z2I943_9TELE|nr:hypothetical protein EYF80_016228 [Liparis tanakae]
MGDPGSEASATSCPWTIFSTSSPNICTRLDTSDGFMRGVCSCVYCCGGGEEEEEEEEALASWEEGESESCSASSFFKYSSRRASSSM